MEFSKIESELRKYDFEKWQNNIDNNTKGDTALTTTNSQLELANIVGDETSINSHSSNYKELVNEENTNTGTKNGLGNKFILYKSNVKKSSNIFVDDKTGIAKNRLTHTGLYFCDDRLNTFMISPDYQFNSLIKDSIIALCEKIQDVETKVAYMGYSIVDINNKISDLTLDLNDKISDLTLNMNYIISYIL